MSHPKPKRETLTKEDFRLLPEGYWNSPVYEPTKVGANSFDEIHVEVGRTLSTWEAIEASLFRLFLLLSNESNAKGSLARTYGYIDSSRIRFTVLISAAQTYFEGDYVKPQIKWVFDSLKTNYEGASQRRNEIAHGVATECGLTENSVFFSRTKRRDFFLLAPSYISGRNSPTGTELYGRIKNVLITSVYCYNASDMQQLSGRLKEFLFTVDRLGSSIGRGADGRPQINRDLIWPPKATVGPKE